MIETPSALGWYFSQARASVPMTLLLTIPGAWREEIIKGDGP
jgi:hypothetical protein